MATRTSLLAQDDNNPNLSGPPSSAMEEESALSRLIAESTPQAALMPFSAALDETTTQSTSVFTFGGGVHKKASFTTILAGSLITLQWGFVWGAYFTKSWMDLHMQISIGWQQKYLPWLDKHTDVVVQGLSVFTLSDNLKDDNKYGSLAGMWICSIVLPSVFMVICPIWILSDYSAPPSRKGQLASRMWLELSIRLGFLVAFILLFLNVAITGIELAWADTDLQVHNAFKGAYISYILGCTCSLLSVVVLRMPFMQHLKLLGYPGQQPKRNPRQVVASSVPEPTPPQALRSPPPNAFQLPWLNSSDDYDDPNEMERPLLENGGRRPQSSLPQVIQPWKHVVIFQLGLLSLLLYFPALALAQFRVLYSGLVMELIKVPAYSVYAWQLPHIVWHTGVRANTPLWILILTGMIMGTFVVLMPLLAYGAAIMTWLRGRGKWRDLLTLIHPTLCGVPFAAGMIATVPAFINIGENMDGDICNQIENVIENQCMISGGVILSGAWFLLAQALCLEAFVTLTLWWTAPPRPPTNTV